MGTNPYAPPHSNFEGPVEVAPDGKTCPRCSAHVSFWRVYFAVGPSFIRCGKCGARLGFDRLNGPGLVLTALLLGVAGLSTQIAQKLEVPAYVSWPLAFIVGAALVTAPVLQYVRRNRRLRVTS
jgi:hypothetical protein